MVRLFDRSLDPRSLFSLLSFSVSVFQLQQLKETQNPLVIFCSLIFHVSFTHTHTTHSLWRRQSKFTMTLQELVFWHITTPHPPIPWTTASNFLPYICSGLSYTDICLCIYLYMQGCKWSDGVTYVETETIEESWGVKKEEKRNMEWGWKENQERIFFFLKLSEKGEWNAYASRKKLRVWIVECQKKKKKCGALV